MGSLLWRIDMWKYVNMRGIILMRYWFDHKNNKLYWSVFTDGALCQNGNCCVFWWCCKTKTRYVIDDHTANSLDKRLDLSYDLREGDYIICHYFCWLSGLKIQSWKRTNRYWKYFYCRFLNWEILYLIGCFPPCLDHIILSCASQWANAACAHRRP